VFNSKLKPGTRNITEEVYMFGFGVQELLIILGIAIVVFGPSKLPQIGAGLGKAIRDFKKGVSSNDESDEVDKEDKKPSKDLPT
jgi:sec-independent protein translocase protein TatA